MKPVKKLGSPEEPDPSKIGPEGVERGEVDPSDAERRRKLGLLDDEAEGGSGYGRRREDNHEDNRV
ncbi:MAG: hypothetical protein PHS14_00860 [Elusimicrobia bacterium]|nr:hypothetical protein [Elusimicrobiota bacterium]